MIRTHIAPETLFLHIFVLVLIKMHILLIGTGRYGSINLFTCFFLCSGFSSPKQLLDKAFLWLLTISPILSGTEKFTVLDIISL